jgi:predicted dehydrogenase
MIKTKFNIAVLGCAAIAERSLIPAIVDLTELFQLSGISSRTEDKANKFAKLFNTKAYVGYQQALDDKTINAVYIPLPNSLHNEWVEKALKAGKHVLVEKSLACTYDQAVELNELAREYNLALVENFQFRFHSQLAYIQEVLKKGTIGEIRCIRSSFGFPGLSSENDIRYQTDLGGGALLDAGAYPVKIVQIFMGNDIEVKAANLNNISDKEVDIWGGAYLKQRNGDLFAEIAFGFQHFYQCNIEIWGSKGKLISNRIFTAGNNVKPQIEIETQDGKQNITLPEDKHFYNMLVYFSNVINNNNLKEKEYIENINQARLIHEIILKNNE